MSPIFSLDGRNALVTGVSSDLGRHFAATLARPGATVAVATRRADKLAATMAEIEAAGGCAFAVVVDVTDAASVCAGFDVIEAKQGPADLVVHHADVAVSRPLLAQAEGDRDGVADSNLKGAWRVVQEGARGLVAARRPGAIINIASITGERVADGVAPY